MLGQKIVSFSAPAELARTLDAEADARVVGRGLLLRLIVERGLAELPPAPQLFSAPIEVTLDTVHDTPPDQGESA